jgi:hypothetical protein
MAITTEQQAVVDEITANFTSLITALSEALEADNDRQTTLEVAAEKRDALRTAAARFSLHNLTGYIHTTTEPFVYLLRDGGTTPEVDGVTISDPNYLVPRI